MRKLIAIVLALCFVFCTPLLTSVAATTNTSSINVKVKDKKAALSDEKVIAAQSEAETALEGRGRLLLRESGTEPVIRVMVECDDEEICRSYAEKVAEAVKNA